MYSKDYFKPHSAKLNKPEVDSNGISDFVVIFTDKGERDLAFWNANKGLWFSVSDPTGFNNVAKWSPFIEPDDFEEDETLYNIGERYE